MVANANTKKNPPPKGGLVKNRQIIKKEEYLFDLDASVQYKAQKVEINPGMESTFPWTSGPAVSYQKWKFRDVKFHFKTSVSTFTPGMVMFGIQTDVNREVPLNKVDLLELANATRSPVWKDFTMAVPKEEQRIYKEYFIRSSPKTDLKLYDPFFLVVGIDGTDVDFPIGELWISYDLELYDPTPIDPSVIMGKFLQITFSGPSTGSGDVIQPTRMFGGTKTSEAGDLLVQVSSVNSIVFNEDFTGLMLYVVNTSGLADSIYEPSAALVINVISSGSAQAFGYWAVGGNGTGGDDNNFVMRAISLINVVKGDTLEFVNGGWYQLGSNASSLEVQFFKLGGTTSLESFSRRGRVHNRIHHFTRSTLRSKYACSDSDDSSDEIIELD